MDHNLNPCGLNGFAFLEFSGMNQGIFHNLFVQMGFVIVANHAQQDIVMYRQGDIIFIINSANLCQAQQHSQIHGDGVCAMGFYVNDAALAYNYAITHGAEPFSDCQHANHGLLAIQAIGGSVIYFVDKNAQPFAKQWQYIDNSQESSIHHDLLTIDHLTHNVYRGNLDKWADFYQQIFNFREIRYFDIQGRFTGLVSRALSSPCNKIKIPLNESKDEHSQIEEFLHEFHGEGIQHIALSAQDIYKAVSQLRYNGLQFLEVPDTYYEMIHDRIPWHSEPLDLLQQQRIIIDGNSDPQGGLLLQIFTANVFGPVFFEIIQRRGNDGFGEGNFQALFDAIERDQIKRGTLLEQN